MDILADELDEMVAGIVAGSNEAFHRVYHLLAGQLAGFAFRQLGDRGAAEDTVQQAFLELARTSGDFRGDGRGLRSWLYASVRFRCADEHRRRARRPERPTDTLPDAAALEPVDNELSPELVSALQTLNPRQRDMIELRHIDGLSGQEIANVLGMLRPAAYAALDRAEAALRKEFGHRIELTPGVSTNNEERST